MSVKLSMPTPEILHLGEAAVVEGEILVNVENTEKAGTVMVSEWFETGLTKGAFSVEASAKAAGGEGDLNAGNVLSYGKEDLFEAAGYISRVPKVKVGAMLTKNNGKLRVALKLKETLTNCSFAIHFVVWGKNPDEAASENPETKVVTDERLTDERFEDDLPDAADTSAEEEADESILPDTAEENLDEDEFYIVNPPKVLHPGWKYVLRTNAENESVVWSTTEGKGTINQYGEFTAPDHAGMVEVCAVREKNGAEASVYIVVRD